MKFDPRSTAIFGLFTTIILAIGGGTIILPLGIPADWLPVIKSWCMFLGMVNSAILTGGAAFSAATSGPLAPPVTHEDVQKLADQAAGKK